MKSKRPLLILSGLLTLITAVGVSTSLLRKEESNPVSLLFAVKRGPLTISVTESGTISNREKIVVKSQVEGKTNILFLVPEGTQVSKGDLLIELDSSKIKDEKAQQQITVLNAEAAYIRAREGLEVARNQVASDLAKAELDYKFAQVDLKKYQAGEYPQAILQAMASITIAREELQRAEDKLGWSQKLYKEGYITRSELQGDELAAKRKRLDVELAESNLRLLEEFTHPRKLEELNSNLEQTENALERAKRKATADIIQAEAEFKAKESEFERQKANLEKLSEQIEKCKITAPVDGVVVYATTGKSKKYSSGPMEEGLEVLEGQPLIHLPTNSSMLAEINIRESSLNKVRLGMPAKITVDAIPSKVFAGRLQKIDPLPDHTMAWMNPDIKVYPAEVYIDGDASSLRPGMTCRVDIIVEEFSDALYIPVQSVVRVNNQPVVYVDGVKGSESRPVQIGLDNDRMIRIVSGLSEGEKVLLMPPLAPSEAPLAGAPSTVPDAKETPTEAADEKEVVK